MEVIIFLISEDLYSVFPKFLIKECNLLSVSEGNPIGKWISS